MLPEYIEITKLAIHHKLNLLVNPLAEIFLKDCTDDYYNTLDREKRSKSPPVTEPANL